MKKVIVCLVVLFVVSSAANALVKINIAGVTASSYHNTDRIPSNLIDDELMLAADGVSPGTGAITDMAPGQTYDYMPYDSDPANPGTETGTFMLEWLPSGAQLGLAPHMGALTNGVEAGHWVEFDLGAVYTDLGVIALWGGHEPTWGAFQGMKDCTILTSMTGGAMAMDWIVAGTVTLDQSPGSIEHMPSTGRLDLTGVAAAQHILIASALGSDAGGTLPPGTWERNYSANGGYSVYFNETALSEVRVYTPEPATMLLLGLGGLVLRRRK